ncbi:MAG: SGNH/GDSL hydrolase family protein [Magnetococcales bacterium]|nr:SGNH/GDSL hydrolase family protein [Magnetococcales bacterium]
MTLSIFLFVVGVELAAMTLTHYWRTQGIWIQDAPYHPYLGYRPRPNVIMSFRGHCAYPELLKRNYYSTNDQGLNPTPNYNWENPEYTIAITGGGSVFGALSTGNATSFPSLLEKIIYDTMKIKVEVVNLAIPGHQSFQEMLGLYDFLKENRADMVISATGMNDAMFGFEEPDIQSASISGAVRQLASVINTDMSLSRYLRANSYAYDLWSVASSKILRKLRDEFSNHQDSPRSAVAQSEQGGKVYENINHRVFISSMHYAMMNTLAIENGAEFRMVLLPTAFSGKKKLTPQEVACSESRVTDDIRYSNDTISKYETKFFNRLDEIPKSYIYHDLRNIFDPIEETMLIDLNHYGDAGAQVVAQAIFERIRPTLAKVASSKP